MIVPGHGVQHFKSFYNKVVMCAENESEDEYLKNAMSVYLP